MYLVLRDIKGQNANLYRNYYNSNVYEAYKKHILNRGVLLLDTRTGVSITTDRDFALRVASNVKGNSFSGGIVFYSDFSSFICKALDIGYCKESNLLWYKGYVYQCVALRTFTFVGGTLYFDNAGTGFRIKGNKLERLQDKSIWFGESVAWEAFQRKMAMDVCYN